MHRTLRIKDNLDRIEYDYPYEPEPGVTEHERTWRGLVWEKRNNKWHLFDYECCEPVAWQLAEMGHSGCFFFLSTFGFWEDTLPNPNRVAVR